ncbi:MAG TPA: hypothetical protein V6C97_27150, partial [Oculatellaceae cyanobacterium]
RLEFQERGAPHFHLLLFGVGFLDREWLSLTWAAICGYEGVERVKHEQAGTNVERVTGYRQATAYLSKYLGKLDRSECVTCDGEIMEPGRWWGTFLLDRYQSPEVRYTLEGPQALRVFRVILRAIAGRGNEYRKGWCKRRRKHGCGTGGYFFFNEPDRVLELVVQS